MANVVSSLPLPRHGGSVPAADPTQAFPSPLQCRGMMTGRARELERERAEAEAQQRTAQPAWPLLQLPTPFGPQSVPLLSPAAFFGGSAPSLLVPPPMQVCLAVKDREGTGCTACSETEVRDRFLEPEVELCQAGAITM